MWQDGRARAGHWWLGKTGGDQDQRVKCWKVVTQPHLLVLSLSCPGLKVIPKTGGKSAPSALFCLIKR